MAMTRRKRRSRRKKLSAEERKQLRRQKKFIADIREVFSSAGFTHFPSRDQNITVDGITSECDSVFAADNVLVVTEDTTISKFESLKNHFRKKAEFYAHALDGRQEELLGELIRVVPALRTYITTNGYALAEIRIVFAYFSLYGMPEDYRARYQNVCSFSDNFILRYFLSLTRSIQRSARFELFKFLKLELAEIGHPSSARGLDRYDAFLISDIPSGFPRGYRLVSFLASPKALMESAYVLRADSWLDADALYQRLLIRKKLSGMREYLSDQGRVFVNNVIVSLPRDCEVRPKGTSGSAGDMSLVQLNLPRRFDSIGIIDGQHRVFCYHEGKDKFEETIATLRTKQHLLVTGIVYPPDVSAATASQFEARLFLEINGKQSNVQPDLKQAIEVIVDPFSDVAIAKAVVSRLARNGPLADKLSTHFFEEGKKIKTASIVGYGLQQLLRPGRDKSSLFRLWRGPKKQAVLNKTDRDALAAYVDFAAGEINNLLLGFQEAWPALWTTDRKSSRALTTTAINGFIFCLRHLVEEDDLRTVPQYAKGFAKMRINFSPAHFQYKSSHWKRLGDALYEQSFQRRNGARSR